MQPISCLKREHSGDSLSRVNFTVQKTAWPEPKYGSTWHRPQLSSSKCVAPRGCVQGKGMACVLKDGATSGGCTMSTQPTELSEGLSDSISDHLFRAHCAQLHAPSAVPQGAHAPCPGPLPITSGSYRVTPHFPPVSFQMSH